MRTIIIAFVASIALTGHAAAQNRSDIGLGFVNRCVGALQSSISTPEPGCACVLGHLSARLSDSQLTIAGRLMPLSADNAALNAEIARLRQQGYSARDITVARNVMTQTSSTSEATCQHLFR